MKILLLIFTFFLISGPVGCFDVIGYSGGSVMIHCQKTQDRGNNKYFCKKSGTECVYLESASTPNTWDHKSRVSVYDASGFLTVTFRDLSLKDTGSYLCGETGAWHDTVKLNVKTDKCCSGPKTVIGYLGEIVTINCFYPEEFKEKAKFFSTLNGQDYTEIAHTSVSPSGRFSVSDDRGSKVVTVRIIDVRKGDEGDYYCGVLGDQGASNYETFFTKIHLQATESKPTTPTTPTAAPATLTSTVTSAPGSSVAITVSIVVVLLLIGGAALVFFIVIVKKIRGSTVPTRTNRSVIKEVPAVVSNDEQTGVTTLTPPKDQDLTYSTPTPPKDQDLTYSTPTPPKDQDLTYSSVSFHKNPGSPTDASVSVRKEEPETEYSTVKRPTALE